MEITFENYTSLKNEKLSRADIAYTLGIPEWKLKRIISRNGWGTKAPTFTNIAAFDEYTELSCYWAGFLAADGSVDTKGRIRLMLKYDDIIQLEKFKSYLGSSHAVSSNTTTYNRCSFELTSKHLCEALEYNFNIVPTKSLVIKFPKTIPHDMRKHFIRGYFDGDGSVCESFSNANSVTSTTYATFCSGSFEFIDYLFKYLQEALSLGGHLQDFGTGKKWQIKYNTNDAHLLLEYMYGGASVYLDRKYALYRRIVVDNVRLKR